MKNNEALAARPAPLATTKLMRGFEQGDIVLCQGERCLIIGIDSDPRATVWVSMVNDVDRSAHVFRDELTHTS